MRHSEKSASRATRRNRCHKARQNQARRRNRWQPAAEQAQSISLQLTPAAQRATHTHNDGQRGSDLAT